MRCGASRIAGVLDATLLEDLRMFCIPEVATYKPDALHRDSPAAPVYPSVPEYQRVIQIGADLLTSMNFPDVRWLAGALIPKWRDEGRRGAHIDWWGWEGSVVDTAREVPPQIGMLFYLQDANLTTGALTFLAGSHRRRIAAADEGWESWEPIPNETVLEAKAGDVVLLDPRALHAVTENSDSEVRLCLTMWFLIDYERLEPRTRATTMLSVPPSFQDDLGPLCPKYEGPAAWFPHVKKPQFPIVYTRIDALRASHTSRDLVGAAAQPNHVFLDLTDTYSWYFAVAAACAPQRILELGVRYGYSLIAMAKGALWAGMRPDLVGVDLEADGVETNALARHYVQQETQLVPRIFKLDTKQQPTVDAAINDLGTYQLAHVDGDHSAEGVAAELAIALRWLRPTGLLLVDDMDSSPVADAVFQLCTRLGVSGIPLPTLHGTMVIDLAKRTLYDV